MATKEELLEEIRRVAADIGTAPGRQRFETETGIHRAAWYGKYWARWSDALRDAGLAPNPKAVAFDDADLIPILIGVIREHGRWPTHGELRVRESTAPGFPSLFSRGRKHEWADKVVKYCEQTGRP